MCLNNLALAEGVIESKQQLWSRESHYRMRLKSLAVCRPLVWKATSSSVQTAIEPQPRLHLFRFHGVLAPNAKLRSKIVPAPPERATEPSTDHAQGQGETPRMRWARLLKRVFDIASNTASTTAVP
jgi:hypothetical protein